MNMTTDEAFNVMNNLDIAEGLKRKFAPGYSLLLFDRTGAIVHIQRFKSSPTEEQRLALLNVQDGCVAISGRPGMDQSPAALQKRITDSMWIFEKMMRKPQS